MLFPTFAFAGDVEYDIAFRGQDAFLIGKVTGVKDNLYSVHIEKILMGDLEATDIQVEKPKYPSGWDNPTVGQYYALSLDKKDTIYEIKFGGYKADSADYKTLKLEYADILGHAVPIRCSYLSRIILIKRNISWFNANPRVLSS